VEAAVVAAVAEDAVVVAAEDAEAEEEGVADKQTID
jgi:hypothetical protein